MEKRNKNPVDQGELAAQVGSMECASEEVERLARFAGKVIDINYLRQLKAIPGNPFLDAA